jgi:hypothetical protein
MVGAAHDDVLRGRPSHCRLPFPPGGGEDGLGGLLLRRRALVRFLVAPPLGRVRGRRRGGRGRPPLVSGLDTHRQHTAMVGEAAARRRLGLL